MRKNICWMLIATVMVGVMGCGTDSQEFNWKTFRWERVGPRDRPRFAAADEAFPEQIPESGMVKPHLTEKQQSAFSKSQIIRLYICEKTPTSIGQGSYYLATQAPVDKLADLLAILYPAQGPGGSEKIRYLLYRDEAIWERAKKFAERLDEAAIEQGTYVVGQGSWPTALGLLYGSEYPRKLAPETRKRVISHLNHVIGDESADREIRWAAAVLAGNLHGRFDPKDFVSASATFVEAMGFAPGDEFEALVVRYHHIQLLMVMNQPIKAKKQAIDALNYFQRWRNTECYERIGIAAKEKNNRRG